MLFTTLTELQDCRLFSHNVYYTFLILSRLSSYCFLVTRRVCLESNAEGIETPIILESGKQILKDGKSSKNNPNIKFVEKINGSAHFEVGSGQYNFEVR